MAKIQKPFAVKGTTATSPKGKALWCKFKEPDTKFNAKGEYSTELVCDPNDPAVQAYLSKIEELRDIAYNETCEALGAAKARGIRRADVYKEEIDQNGKETGNIIFKYKLKDLTDRQARGDASEIVVVDAKKNNLGSQAPLVGNGSTIRVVSYVNPYYMASTKTIGISHIWSKMQIIELNEYSGGGGDDFDEEEGFEETPATSEDTAFAEDDF